MPFWQLHICSRKMKYSSGDQIYKYSLALQIGEGQFGQVWKCVDGAIEKEVAVKILPTALALVKSTLEEAVIGNKLTHENLIPIYGADIAKVNGEMVTLISQQYLPAGSVQNKATVGNFLPIPDVLATLVGVLRGLEYLHQAGIFHNDVKPTNILIGLKGQPVLSDYGIAAMVQSGTSAVAKDMYLIHCAPETCATKTITIQTDIYQVGVTAFRLLNGLGSVVSDFFSLGKDEFEKRKIAGLIPNQDDYRPWVPLSLKRIVNRAMNTDSAHRYQSAIEMLRALEHLKYRGYWTQDTAGNYIGIGEKYKYDFEMIERSGKYSVESRRCTEDRKTRISKFCGQGLTKKQAEKLISKFMQWVVAEAT